jgi:hypothetical protein
MALTIDCADPLGAGIGMPYSHQIEAWDGVAPYAFALAAGALPPGLTLNAAGLISGVATQVGAFTFTVDVTDGALATAQAVCAIAVACANTGVGSANYCFGW